MKIFSPILKGTTTVAQGTTNLSGSFTGSLFGTAATASYADNFTVGGTLTAQTINVQVITSSIEFNTGSTRNGALSTNIHQFTGSVLMSGSLTVGSSITAASTVVTGVGEDGSSGPVMRLNSTHPNAGSRNWAIINTWDNFGDLTFRVSNNKDGNAITSGSTRMVILSSGNVGIGTSLPQRQFVVSNGGAEGMEILAGSGRTTIISYNRATSTWLPLVLTEGSGNVLIGTTTDSGYKLATNGIVAALGSANSLLFQNRSSTNTYEWYATSGIIYIYSSTSASNILQINGSSGAYTALSDSNKKKNFELSNIGLNEVLQLKPTLYHLKTEDDSFPKDLGFIAQEVKDYIPQAYVETGDEDNKFIGLNQMPIIAALTKAIQELKSENDTLKEILQRNNIQ